MKKVIFGCLFAAALQLTSATLLAQRGRGMTEVTRVKVNPPEEKPSNKPQAGSHPSTAIKTGAESPYSALNPTATAIARNIKSAPSPTGTSSEWAAARPVVKRTRSLDPNNSGTLSLYRHGADQTITPANFKVDHFMLYLPDQHSPRANWNQNFRALREEVSLKKPIYDSYRKPDGSLAEPEPGKGRFLNAERTLLKNKGYRFDTKTGTWLLPAQR